MIVRMSKIEIVGEKPLLQQVLSLLRELGIFQIEPATVGFIEKEWEKDVRSFMLDDKTVFERIFLEELRQKIELLFAALPALAVRKSYIEPVSILDTVSKTIDRHRESATELSKRREVLVKERSELGRYSIFLNALASLVETTTETPDLDFIGLTIREPEMVEHLRQALSRITNWKYELQTEPAEDGTLVGLITVEKGASDKVKKSLSDEHVPELTFPESFGKLTFPEKVTFIKKRADEVLREIQAIDAELARFTRRWVPIYQRVQEWIDDRLSLLNTTAFAFETRMCFFIHGWMQSEDLARLKQRLHDDFGTKVMIEEKEMHEEDLEQVPIVLKNPSYFKPFELFTSLLPLPAYTSYDPTPFIGIFFPIFFGMILGDAGYALVLAIIALILLKKNRQKGPVRDGAKILLIAAAYSAFFGVLFGEFFGDLPERFLHMEPLCMERRTAIVPMLAFAVAVGVAHIILGLILGAINAFKHKIMKEAAYKALSVVIILCLIVILASMFGYFPTLLARPVVLVILFLTPFLFFAGGILAPLELLKSIGNIISYVRIAAIGLTSVLLAFVANNLAGVTGDVVTGVVVAGLIHLLNIILGVFSPTIHSLRLHYVEFFSKFIEHGGKKFAPLKKA
jgi:V/A-type H+/Na+-transporting ATPase subunit I